MRRSESQNVIAELPGSEPDGGIITFGAHHDTQADSVGADDNASGAAGLLELARVLAPLPRRQSLRLVSFGTEEQLSVGSAEYVRGHRKELNERGRLMINLDSFGSWLGWTEVVCNGPTEVERSLANEFAVHGLFAKFIHDIVPYADHFPFVAAGVPGVYIGRANCAGGRFFHHRPDDDMSRVSPELMARLLTAVATWSAGLAAARTWPLPSAIPADQAEAARIFWEDLFGGWAGVPLE
ncbi:MAG: Zn-dependent exopeptidase M28, partial [Chloroflexi bacterium]|nr:Zn-dependent exopeptidase M28 [Chloroflexota bacterium]